MPADALPPLQQNRLLGIGLRVGAGVCFACMGASIKLSAEHGAHLTEIAFYRFAFGLPPLLVWMALTGSFGAWRTQRPLAHLWRGTIGLSTMIVAFTAVTLLPLAEATTLSFIAPLFSVALSATFLGEHVGRYRWTAVAVGLLGVIVVMQPGGTQLHPLGLGLAVLAALGVAGVTITLRQIGKTERTPTIVLWFTCFAMLVTGVFLPFYGQTHDLETWAILLGLGLSGGIGQLFLTSSLRFAPVTVVVPFDYSQLLWAVLLGWWLWDTHPAATTGIGAAIIVGSGLYTLYREHKLGRDRAKAEVAVPL